MAVTEQDHLHRWLCADAEAVALAELFGELSQLWDDLIDEDQPVSTAQREHLFRLSLVELPKNGFYQRYFYQLQPVLEDRLYTWLDCNRIERGGSDAQLQAAYILRSVVTDLVIHMAYLIGGYDWRQQVAFEVREYVYGGNESWPSYRREHRGD